MQSLPFWRKGQIVKTQGTKVIAATVFGAVLLLGNTAWAGAKLAPEVAIGSNTARGSMVGARYSTDTVQRIGCTLDAKVNQSSVFCAARDRNGVNLSCFSANPGMREAVQALTDSSYIYFAVNSTGVCTYLQVQDDSQFLK
jgi:hypothetical protein